VHHLPDLEVPFRPVEPGNMTPLRLNLAEHVEHLVDILKAADVVGSVDNGITDTGSGEGQ